MIEVSPAVVVQISVCNARQVVESISRVVSGRRVHSVTYDEIRQSVSIVLLGTYQVQDEWRTATNGKKNRSNSETWKSEVVEDSSDAKAVSTDEG